MDSTGDVLVTGDANGIVGFEKTPPLPRALSSLRSALFPFVSLSLSPIFLSPIALSLSLSSLSLVFLPHQPPNAPTC